MTGNAGTVDGTNFIGTTDNVPLTVKINSVKSGYVGSNGSTFLGYNSGNVSNQSSNTGIGLNVWSHVSNTGSGNTAIGANSMGVNTGNYNVAMGFSALNFGHGSENVAIGISTLGNCSAPGDNNVAIGSYALQNNTSGMNNTGIGQHALRANLTGTFNIAIGYYSSKNTTSGYRNISLGAFSLQTNTTGQTNTAIGMNALYYNTTGNYNIGIGEASLISNVTGTGNLAIGYGADVTSGALTSATAIGYQAKVSTSNSLVLGGTGTNAVNVGIGTTSPAANLDVVGTVKITDGTEGAGKVLTSDGTGNATWQTASGPAAHYIGESYGGGIVFFVYDGGAHGLIASTADQSAGIQWSNNGIWKFIGVSGDGVGSGDQNTSVAIAAMVNDNQNGAFAARACADYSVVSGGMMYGDWYMPSWEELKLLYAERVAVGGFANAEYWSSTEVAVGTGSGDLAYMKHFGSAAEGWSQKQNPKPVRAIRAF
ncbi:MAG: hypothetical protein ACJA0U_002260 [Salibacteraceae bacterium]